MCVCVCVRQSILSSINIQLQVSYSYYVHGISFFTFCLLVYLYLWIQEDLIFLKASPIISAFWFDLVHPYLIIAIVIFTSAFCYFFLHVSWASRVVLVVKNTPANAGDLRCGSVMWSLGGEGPLENEVATHSSILAWRIPWTEETGELWSTGSQRVGHDWSDFTSMCFFTSLFFHYCFLLY